MEVGIKELARRVARVASWEQKMGEVLFFVTIFAKYVQIHFHLKKKQLSFSSKKKSPGQMVSLENSTQCLKNQCQ